MKHYVLDADDFSVMNNQLELLIQLKEHYPKLKVSMFMIPFDARFETNPQTRSFRPKALELLKKNLDWIQLIPHGLTHIEHEFENADKTSMLLTLKAIDEVFKKDGLPYEKGFKAPYWLWNKDVVEVLDEQGWWGAIDPRQPQMAKTKKFYAYNYSMADPFWTSERDLLKIHGHIDGKSANDIEKVIMALMKIPTDTEFHFCTDYLEETK